MEMILWFGGAWVFVFAEAGGVFGCPASTGAHYLNTSAGGWVRTAGVIPGALLTRHLTQHLTPLDGVARLFPSSESGQYLPMVLYVGMCPTHPCSLGGEGEACGGTIHLLRSYSRFLRELRRKETHVWPIVFEFLVFFFFFFNTLVKKFRALCF